jgi:hypothetical protein
MLRSQSLRITQFDLQQIKGTIMTITAAVVRPALHTGSMMDSKEKNF